MAGSYFTGNGAGAVTKPKKPVLNKAQAKTVGKILTSVGHTARDIRYTINGTHARRNPVTRSSGGGGGSGSSGGGGATAPTAKPAKAPKTKAPKSTASASQVAKPAAPGGPNPDDKMWAETFDPARRELQRQQDLLNQQKAASQSAWDSYNKWAEDKRAQSAGLLTSSQQASQKAYSDQRAASDKAIAGYVDAARGGTGAPPQGADMAQATGAGAFAESQAALSKGDQAQAQWKTANDAIAQQQMQDRQGIQQAMATQGSNDINASFSKAAAALAAKRGELESSIGQAKLDKFYKDRQYGLDRETLDWTKSLQGAQLGEQARQFNVGTALKQKQLSVQEKIAAGQLGLSQVKAQIDAQYKSGRLSDSQRKTQLAAAKAGADQYKSNNANALKIAGDVRTSMGTDWAGRDTNEQGEFMRQTASQFMAAGVPLSIAMKQMAAIFGNRWSGFPAAVAETKKIFGGK